MQVIYIYMADVDHQFWYATYGAGKSRETVLNSLSALYMKGINCAKKRVCTKVCLCAELSSSVYCIIIGICRVWAVVSKRAETRLCVESRYILIRACM